ncbi:uncharacterized protein LOC130721874 [Lotus japonicus]|uniref:uncharacterized protein LOC130721874 n=1 Tax=Lotus japonicus TaxID=34305 RepID=UPI00258D164F|nr:uncharacterized protein LOC130721874 [Lotus japonicus]
MALIRWLVHSACHVLGYTKEEQCKQNIIGISEVKCLGSSSSSCSGFQMPLHYPRYTKAEYESMEEWKLDLLLNQYGLLSFKGNSLHDKRAFAMGAFLWPDQY